MLQWLCKGTNAQMRVGKVEEKILDFLRQNVAIWLHVFNFDRALLG
jgi:hypothetical protein